MAEKILVEPLKQMEGGALIKPIRLRRDVEVYKMGGVRQEEGVSYTVLVRGTKDREKLETFAEQLKEGGMAWGMSLKGGRLKLTSESDNQKIIPSIELPSHIRVEVANEYRKSISEIRARLAKRQS